MTLIWSILTVTVGPAVLAFVVNTLAPRLAEKLAEKMAGPLSDRFIDWFCRKFPRAGRFLFRRTPVTTTAEPEAASAEGPCWHYSGSGERVGPVTAAELRALYSVGKLHSLSMVWREGMATWATLASVEGELPAPAKVKIELPPKRFSVGPGGVFVGVFALFFVLFLAAVVGANLTLAAPAR